ncbi:DEAD/DEAH box helicase [Nocardioides sp. zg-1308]|uniref:DEAD/DEAH box helicase n=1 Tax=Nocardioides renjunii TaxID=3095075 RepID=A0ABU5KCA4_9ACTN|nr:MULTISPECIES: DEAD/DEAH box helicase [unclassified Nocardioides]MDZ5662610.1 DEAD/DEAH box helicase [Nocardioides sp. S-58]NPD05720.1 DEAD/DEAH box helicase [Nocardioides sp. zg-1308]
MAQRQRSRGSRRTPAHARHKDNEGIVPVLARAVRELESAVQRGPLAPGQRVRFQVVALLAREHRTHVRASTELSDAQKADELKRLDGIATILAKTATRDPSLFGLLSEDSVITDSARDLRLEMLRKAGIEAVAEEPKPDDESGPGLFERRVIPQSVVQHQLANPFLVPDFDIGRERRSVHGQLATWELLGPLFRSFELGGSSSCMDLPEATSLNAPGKLELMPHQARLIAAAAEGHRTFLLADEPGLGKTAQALLAAQAADAFPLLVVCPNVVKTNWARETERWTPRRRATVIHGDGDQVDAFADVIIVNYEILDRHAGWLGSFGFRGMVVDEAHFIKNKTSQRSRHVLELSERLRTRTARPLLMALTGTPLINDIEDFRAIWQFLGWIDDTKPMARLMERLEETELTPADAPFYPAARKAVIDMGIVRRRKVDVAEDIPARRIADIPVELDDEDTRSIRAAEDDLARRLVQRYRAALETRRTGSVVDGIDHELVRRVATWEREEMDQGTGGENVFSMFRRIGRAKAGLAADYAAQLARNVGKVVFFARHVDVMDIAEETFTRRGLKHASIRGDQTPKARERAIEAFVNDPDVQVIVCSLAAAGVGVNLQVASNVVLSELSWTDAEQTQAIDRVHRIGQSDPVTAWRIIAAQTIDTRIAELIDSKAGLAARALDGSDEEVTSSANIQTEALVTLLTEALERELG